MVVLINDLGWTEMVKIKYKIKTPRMTSEFDGEVKEGIRCAFASIDNPEDRIAVIASLQETHSRMVAREAERTS